MVHEIDVCSQVDMLARVAKRDAGILLQSVSTT